MTHGHWICAACCGLILAGIAHGVVSPGAASGGMKAAKSAKLSLSDDGFSSIESDGIGMTKVVPDPSGDWKRLAKAFRIGARAAGYMRAEEFMEFLSSGREGRDAGGRDLGSVVERKGWVLAIVLILAGGLALNLTPCVLPMIPVNLAIIGAGAEASDKRRGWLLGSAFGGGMAIVYGVLGLAVVATGATFGALNASPWFNAAIAALFLVMALAMFDVIPIDFSAFQSRVGGGGAKKGSLPAAFALGGVMALLAGACVAPVVISLLLFATDLYIGGRTFALFLPFLLGVGMALPWPFAGAGLSFLPKPGQWMRYVKYGFGIVILAAAVYYGYLAADLFAGRGAAARARVVQAQAESVEGGWMTSLPDALALATERRQPVLIDFWASWCKSCLHMDRTTFKDPAVVAALDAFVAVKYQAERPADPDVKAVLDHFGVLGLPTYVVLLPE